MSQKAIEFSRLQNDSLHFRFLSRLVLTKVTTHGPSELFLSIKFARHVLFDNLIVLDSPLSYHLSWPDTMWSLLPAPSTSPALSAQITKVRAKYTLRTLYPYPYPSKCDVNKVTINFDEDLDPGFNISNSYCCSIKFQIRWGNIWFWN